MRRGTRLGVALGLLVLTCAGAQAATTTKLGNGDGQVLLEADEALYDVNAQIVTARGHVEIDSGGRILRADSVSYNQKTDTVTADGHVSVLNPDGNVAFAEHVKLTDQMRNGVLDGFGALIGQNGRLAAAHAVRKSGQYVEAYHAAYTPCKICNLPGQRTPVWRVKAYHVIDDETKHKLRFNDATIEFFGVPVFYTPYLTQADPSVKYTSGILAPDIGSSSLIGSFISVPVYLSLSSHSDATIAPLFTTQGGDMIEGEYRQRWNDGGMWLQGSLTYNPNGLAGANGVPGTPDQIYGHIFGSGRIPLDNSWSTGDGWLSGFDVQLTSYSKYLRAYEISPLDRLVSDLFVVDESGRSRFAVTGYFFQGLRQSDNNRSFPVPLPLVEYTYIPLDKIWGGQFRFDFNGVAISRDEGTDDQRLTAQMSWRLPFVTDDGQLITFEANARGDLYHFSDGVAPLPSGDHYVTRGMPYTALDWRWPLISGGQTSQSYIVEPIAQVVLAPYGGNPTEITELNEDATSEELDENNLFSFDQLSGYDLIEDGPRANLGLRTETRFSSGYVEALVGESFRLKADPIFAPDSPLAGTISDIVGRFSIKFPPYIDLTHRIDIDQSSGTVRRNEVYLTGILGRSSLQISYVQLAPELVTLGLDSREEINAQANLNFYKNWQVFAAARRDLFLGTMLDAEGGLGYEDECLGVSVAYRRRYTSDFGLKPSTSFVLRFKLKTGQETIDPFSLFPQDVFSYTHP